MPPDVPFKIRDARVELPHMDAGKTTLADLILGLHKLDSGSMTIDNVSYRDPTLIPRGTFGYVPQDPFLIDDTIRRNIARASGDRERWSCASPLR